MVGVVASSDLAFAPDLSQLLIVPQQTTGGGKSAAVETEAMSTAGYLNFVLFVRSRKLFELSFLSFLS